MECELNPRIPYTELSHIIKKQKEVRPASRRVLPGSACSGPCQPPPKGRGEGWGCVGPWEPALESPLGAGSRGEGHCGGVYGGWAWLQPWAAGAAGALGPWGPTSRFGSPEYPAVPAHLPASNLPFLLQIIKKLIERKQAQIRKVYPGLTCFKEGVRQIPIESVPGIRESGQLLVGKGCLAGGLYPSSPTGVGQTW